MKGNSKRLKAIVMARGIFGYLANKSYILIGPFISRVYFVSRDESNVGVAQHLTFDTCVVVMLNYGGPSLWWNRVKRTDLRRWIRHLS